MPGGHVTAQAGICLGDTVTLEAPITSGTFRAAHSRRNNLLFLHQCSDIEQTIDLVVTQTRIFNLYCIFFTQTGRNIICAGHCFLVIGSSYAVILNGHRIDTSLQHFHILTIGLTAHDTGIYHIEIGIKFNDGVLFAESFTTIRDIPLIHVLRFQIFKLLTTKQMKIQMLLICRHLKPSGVSLDNLRILKPLFKVINQHVIKHTCLTVFMLYIKIITVYLVIEHTFRNIYLRRLLLQQ